MARILEWPVGLRWNRMRWLSGPESVDGSSGTTIGNFTQTVASPFGARYIALSFPPLRGEVVRRARGMITALHKGANAVRVPVCDWDGISLAQAGAIYSEAQKRDGMPWSNGQPWSNGKNWKAAPPIVSVAAAAALDASVIRLESSFWGRQLDVGDWIGFFPAHFGLYEVTEVFSAGHYRIWPPLRKAIATTDYATLKPVMAMRFLSSNLPDSERGPAFLENLTLSLFEVFDYDIRAYFEG